MLERDIYNQYRIEPKSFFEMNGYKAFEYKGSHFLVVPADQFDSNELLEMKYLSDYLIFQGERELASIVPTVSKDLVSEHNQKRMLLFSINRTQFQRYLSKGRELAEFHVRGRFYPYPSERLSRIGQWRTLWEKRLEQLEHWWMNRLQLETDSGCDVEKALNEVFPYYLGLSENAIQFIADADVEDRSGERYKGTICHIRYQPFTTIDAIKLPINLVYDHHARDIAESVRAQYWENNDFSANDLAYFFNDYEQVFPLTAYSWRLIYGRLLFPINFFEAVEGFYTSHSETEKEYYRRNFFTILQRSSSYEVFLRYLFDQLRIPSAKLGIPKIDWLAY